MMQIIKKLVPPILIDTYRRLKNIFYGYHGNYSSWEEAAKKTTGYEENIILEKVRKAVISVKNGEAAFERDSVLFNQIVYSWPVLAGLLWAASQNNGNLHVLDFGGSLGSSYFQNRKFLKGLASVTWSIIEQKHFVACGLEYIQDEQLQFFESINECIAHKSANVVLLSSVLQYLPEWESDLELILQTRIPVIIVDRTTFVQRGAERITIQRVPNKIYSASYPCRFFSEDEFISLFNNGGYRLIEKFKSLGNTNIKSSINGYIFALIDTA